MPDLPEQRTEDAAVRVRDAVERTLQAGTARIRQTMLGPAGRVVATGLVDFVQRRATAVLSLPPHPDAPDPEGATDVTMIIDGVDTYTQVIDRPGRFILDRLANAGESLSAGDPGMLLDLLRGAVSAATIDDAGSEDPAMTAFDVQVDLDLAIERAPDDFRRPLRDVIDGVWRDVRPERARVHLDADGRIRYVDIAPGGRSEERLEVELSDLGADIVIELPDAASILDPDEMAELGAELQERFGDEDIIPPTGDNDPHRPAG